MRMYLSIPDGSGRFPAVLVTRQGPGVNDFIQDIVNDLAKAGYVGPSVDGEHLGKTVFCVGGRTTWLGAATNPHFKAAVPFFGDNTMVLRGETDQSPFDRTSGIAIGVYITLGGLESPGWRYLSRNIRVGFNRLSE